jgi:hypothetical protein
MQDHRCIIIRPNDLHKLEADPSDFRLRVHYHDLYKGY